MDDRHGTFWNFWRIFAVFLLVSVVVTVGEVCKKINGSLCACSNSKGKIDLFKLSAGARGPRWSQLRSERDVYLYSYDPCTPFIEPNPPAQTACKGVLACQMSPQQFAVPLAQSNRGWETIGEVESNNLVFQYSAISEGLKRIMRTLRVELYCTKEEVRIEILGEEVPNSLIYGIKLYSVYACYDGVFPSRGVSFGTVLCIIFLLFVVFYCLGGFLFLTYIRQARGVERIPHVEFWRDFPHLVKDGTQFVVKGCKVDTTYDRI